MEKSLILINYFKSHLFTSLLQLCGSVPLGPVEIKRSRVKNSWNESPYRQIKITCSMNRWWKIGNLSPLIKKASVLDQSIDPNLKPPTRHSCFRPTWNESFTFRLKIRSKRVALNESRVETSRHLSNVNTSFSVIKVVVAAGRGDAGSLCSHRIIDIPWELLDRRTLIGRAH